MSSNQIYQYEEKLPINQILQKVLHCMKKSFFKVDNFARAAKAGSYICLYTVALGKVGEVPQKSFLRVALSKMQ